MIAPDTIQDLAPLHCFNCGNDSVFVELMEHVENFVDSNFNHVHLAVGIPAAYYCRECGDLVRRWQS